LFGSAPFGSIPFGTSGDDFKTDFDLHPPAGQKPIIEIASFVEQILIERLHRYPHELQTIDRRRFEELVAELFAGFGYEVELTQRTRDGGKDIVAVRQCEVNLRFLIECKRPEPGNPVKVNTVRELLGVKVDDGATKAIIATTTYLSLDARQFVEKHRWELESREFAGIQEWIETYLKQRGRTI
jgi:restriction system protein